MNKPIPRTIKMGTNFKSFLRDSFKIFSFEKKKNENRARIYATLPDLVKASRIKKLITIKIVLAINHFFEYLSVYKNIKIVLINKWTDLSPFL